MATHAFLLAAALLALSCFHAIASDPSLLQDFCVADNMSTGIYMHNYYFYFYIYRSSSVVSNYLINKLTVAYIHFSNLLLLLHAVRVNGLPCKDAKDVVTEDFFFPGLHMAGNTTNKQGSAVTPVNVAQIAGLNTLASLLLASIMHPMVLTLLTHIHGPLKY
jgi:hypothetical protein